MLIKNPKHKNGKASIQYKDIGDYHNREEKLEIVKKLISIGNVEMQWKPLNPNEHGDWIIQRNDIFETFIQLEPEKKFALTTKSFFNVNGPGIATGRDSWIYNFSKKEVASNMKTLIAFYNEQQKAFSEAKSIKVDLKVEDYIDSNTNKISWTRALRKNAEKGIRHILKLKEICIGAYRPYSKQIIYFHKPFLESPGLSSLFKPNQILENKVIALSSSGTQKGLSVLISDFTIDYHLVGDTQCFPLYYYEQREKQSQSMFDEDGDSEYIRRDGVSDFILDRAKKQYGKNVTKEDIFYYVYGFLHSPMYRITFANDLKKMLPRLPLVEDVRDFWKFSKAGRALADLHINYESVPPYKGLKVTGAESKFFTVDRMRFPKKDQKDTIFYNSKITIENIPVKAYEYVVNGKSAIEWIMERYQITTHKESGIRNDPNDWAKEVGNPRYILDLLLSVINVSVQTVEIVNSLPVLKFEE